MPTWAAPKADVKPAVIAYDEHSVARSSDGSTWYWGGIADVIKGKFTLRDNTPKLMPTLKDAVDIQAFRNKHIILKENGEVWEWEPSFRMTSEVIHEVVTEFPEPKRIEELSNITKISAGSIFSAIDKDGSVWVWHPLVYYNGIHKLENITDAKDVSWNGDAEVHILREDGTVWKWAAYSEDLKFVPADKQYRTHKFEENNKYAVRNIEVNPSYSALKIEGLEDIVALSKGSGKQNFAIGKDGSVWGWGENLRGKLGLPEEKEFVDRPVKITGLSDVSSIVTSMFSTLILKKDGTLWVLGYNVGDHYLEFKNGHELRRIDGLEKVTSITLGASHAVAITEDGKLWAWGKNDAGQLGNASFKDSMTPILVKKLQ
ncbi:RCC1 domain-containing protein [Paenibacillus puerhi]|uniref:RCC1 domain-containing protein n=1 Tax=Paenibacillus puerhi TaxID=2692622 RepID=UPI001F1D9CA1|nr:hypothetical protein [Paenibacillus puerhi]